MSLKRDHCLAVCGQTVRRWQSVNLYVRLGRVNKQNVWMNAIPDRYLTTSDLRQLMINRITTYQIKNRVREIGRARNHSARFFD